MKKDFLAFTLVCSLAVALVLFCIVLVADRGKLKTELAQVRLEKANLADSLATCADLTEGKAVVRGK